MQVVKTLYIPEVNLWARYLRDLAHQDTCCIFARIMLGFTPALWVKRYTWRIPSCTTSKRRIRSRSVANSVIIRSQFAHNPLMLASEFRAAVVQSRYRRESGRGRKQLMPTLTEVALRRTIAAGETSTVELKKAVPRPSELAERMCGMANAQGGLIIIGVEDSSLAVVGVPDGRMALTRDMVLRAARQIDPPLLLDPPEPEVYVLDGKQVVVAAILPSRGP